MALPTLNNVSLVSTGKKNGTGYTEQEYGLARQIAIAAFVSLGQIPSDDDRAKELTDETVEVFTAAASEEFADIPSLMRKIYREVEKSNVGSEGFPKRRDPSSINLIFRKSIGKLNIVDDNTLNQMFKRYGAKKAS